MANETGYFGRDARDGKLRAFAASMREKNWQQEFTLANAEVLTCGSTGATSPINGVYLISNGTDMCIFSVNNTALKVLFDSGNPVTATNAVTFSPKFAFTDSGTLTRIYVSSSVLYLKNSSGGSLTYTITKLA